jgi:hypothetical protein
MRLRVLGTVCVVCMYLSIFRGVFYKASYKYARMLVHSMLYLEGQINCKKVSESWKETVHHQRLVDFLNHGHLQLNQLNEQRIEHLLPLVMGHRQNQQDLLGDYLLFSIDPSDFKKYKNKKMQGGHYTRDANGGYKAQTFVMSSLIYGQSCVPFKKILYWGKKGVPKGRQLSKNRIYLKLATKAEQVDTCGTQRLAVFDAAGCNRTVLPYFHKSPEWRGFVCKFPRTRNIIVAGKTTHIRTYLANLTQQDFVRGKVAGKEVWYHVLTATVPSLSFLGTVRLVVIQDEPGNLNQKTFRVLITDVMDLSSEHILLIYLRRWKQETYHQIIKDRLGVRSYKHRKLKAVMRLLELADLAYCFLEYRRLKAKVWQDSLSEVRNDVIQAFETSIATQYHLPLPKHAQQAA